jgi:hypothetical protein
MPEPPTTPDPPPNQPEHVTESTTLEDASLSGSAWRVTILRAGATTYQSFYNTGPAGTLAHQIPEALRTLIGSSLLEYQNHAGAGTTYAWTLATGIVSAIAAQPSAILILVTTPQLLIAEILPWTAGTDDQAATLRTWNTNLAAWCAANSATLIPCHDAMAKTRVSTGHLDDLATAYDDDGVHLTQAGVDAYAAIALPYL